MAKFKSIIINGFAVVAAVLFTVGALNMDEIVNLIQYVNAHTSTGMAVFYYVSAFTIFFLFPLIGGAATEFLMSESNTRIGNELANVMHNVRNGWVPFIAFGLFGGLVTFFCSFGIITIICG